MSTLLTDEEYKILVITKNHLKNKNKEYIKKGLRLGFLKIFHSKVLNNQVERKKSFNFHEHLIVPQIFKMVDYFKDEEKFAKQILYVKKLHMDGLRENFEISKVAFITCISNIKFNFDKDLIIKVWNIFFTKLIDDLYNIDLSFNIIQKKKSNCVTF